MPIPALESEFTPEMVELLRSVEQTIFTLSGQTWSREQAIVIRQTVSRPLGVLASKNGLRTGKNDRCAKCGHRHRPSNAKVVDNKAD